MSLRFPRRRRRRPTHGHVDGYSIYDPIPFGIDENGLPVAVTLMYRNLLAGGEPGSGKSSLLNTIIAHAALCSDVKLWLFDGKIVELGPVAPGRRHLRRQQHPDALDRLRELQAEMDTRYRQLDAAGRRKIVPPTGWTSSSASSTNSPTSPSPSAPRRAGRVQDPGP